MNTILALVGGAAHTLAGASLGALAIASLLHAGKLAAEARAWHGIVRHTHTGEPVRFRTMLGAFVGSIGANAILPARVGEAFRIGIVRRHAPGSSVITLGATIVLETAIEVVFGVLVIAAVLLAGRSLGPHAVAPGAALLGHPVVLAVAAAVLLVVAAVSLVFRARVRAFLARAARGFAVVRSPRMLVQDVLVWKVLAWTLRIGTVYAFLLAFHVSAAPWAVLAVIAAQNVAASVPLLPGNAGTQQAAIGLILAGTASASALLGFGVGMQAATTVADIALGACAIALVAGRQDVTRARAKLNFLRWGRPHAVPVAADL